MSELNGNQTAIVCRFFKKGVCRFGDRCRNSHDVSSTVEDLEKNSSSIGTQDQNNVNGENAQEPQKNGQSTSKNDIACSTKNSTTTLNKVKKPKRNVKKTKRVWYGEAMTQDSDLSCSICMEILIKPTLLNCSHIFCEWCIDKWSKLNVQCPVCRNTIINSVYCLSIDNHIKKMIDQGPISMKTAYEIREYAIL